MSVSGQVTIDGKPVPTGTIEFYPTSGRPALGEIDGEGRYTLRTHKPGDGVKPGKYRVTITSRNIPEDDGPTYNSFEDEMRGVAKPAKQKAAGRKPARITWIVPKQYSHRSSTDLEVEVKDDGQEINFPILSKS